MASPLILANNVAAQLAANIGPSDTALLVTAGQGARFPVIVGGQYYYVTLIHIATGLIEVVKVTARAADTLTILRGQDSTTAIPFTTGSIVEMRASAQIFREVDWRNAVNVGGGIAGLDGAGFLTDGLIPATITRDTELAAGLGTKENALGYPPVQQGTGVGQTTNLVKIGWSVGSKVLVTIDATNMGAIAMESWVLASRGIANGLAPLDAGNLVPVGHIPALGYLPTAGGTILGSLAVNGGATVAGALSSGTLVQTHQNFSSAIAAVVLATATAGTVYLRPNGAASATGELQLNAAGVATAVNFVATSDRRMKKQVRKHVVREELADTLQLKSWVWKRTGDPGLGPIAQSVQDVAPEYVHRDAGGMLAIDKGGLAIEMALGLAARLRRLEASHVS